MNLESQGQACPQYEAMLEDFLNGELSGMDKRDLVEHLKSCGSCKAALDEAERSSRLLRLMEASADPGPAFSRIVMARIHAEQESARQPRGFWQPFVSLAWRVAASAAVALVVMVTYDVASHQSASVDTNTPVVQSQVPDMFTTDAYASPANRDDGFILVSESENGKQ
jgi:anti-sigma factor RsiW